EALSPMVEEVAGGTACLRILSNLADRRLARAAVRIPFSALARDGQDGAEVAERILYAYEFAAADPYRAATHNKGIMNGIDALAAEGIQKGHMALHARAVSHAAGARGEEAEELRRRLLAAGEVKIDRARELLRALEPRS